MDYPLGDVLLSNQKQDSSSGLNPYSNGLPSRGSVFKWLDVAKLGLNPYSNGLPSRGSERTYSCFESSQVLIPILMDYPLGDVPFYRHTELRES